MGLIRITYEIMTPESAELGDADERGWIDEDGTEYSVDEVIKLCRYLYPSSSSFHTGIWYTDVDKHEDFRTGAVESWSYHLENFSPEEEAEVYRYNK